MKYYRLTFSKNRKEVGKIPQSEKCLMGDIQQDFIPRQGKIDFDFTLPEPILEKKTKQTSYISVVAISRFLVIDDQLLTFLKRFNIGNYQKWKIKTWQNKELIEKYNLFIINDTKQNKYLDFSKSEFYSKKLGDWNNSSVQKSVFVKNYDEYCQKKEKLRKDKLMLLHRKITLDFSFAKEDMFRIINTPLGGYFGSEKLKTDIERMNFTGMSFQEIEEIDSRISVKY